MGLGGRDSEGLNPNFQVRISFRLAVHGRDDVVPAILAGGEKSMLRRQFLRFGPETFTGGSAVHEDYGSCNRFSVRIFVLVLLAGLWYFLGNPNEKSPRARNTFWIWNQEISVKTSISNPLAKFWLWIDLFLFAALQKRQDMCSVMVTGHINSWVTSTYDSGVLRSGFMGYGGVLMLSKGQGDDGSHQVMIYSILFHEFAIQISGKNM